MLVKNILHFLIRVYQFSLSPLLGNRCRFYPSCSCYAHACISQYPLRLAITKIITRLLRCHPLNAGGVDLP